MRFVISLLLVSIAVSLAAEASAKDVCLGDGVSSEHIIFRKVKPVKAGGAVTLNGMWYSASPAYGPAACTGSAAANGAGTLISVGIFCHSLLLGNNFTLEWTATDQTLAGSGDRDLDGDYVPDGLPFTLIAQDCSTLTVP